MRLKGDLESRREIEAGLGSLGRLKILGALAGGKEFLTKYALERDTGLKPVDVRSNLKVLVEIGWVEEYRYQPRKYRLNLENPNVAHLVHFLNETRYIARA